MAELIVYWSMYPYEMILLQVGQPRTCGDIPREGKLGGRTGMCMQPIGPLHGENHRCVFRDGEVWEWG